jgi:DNA-directed RNA polymerase subunit F
MLINEELQPESSMIIQSILEEEQVNVDDDAIARIVELGFNVKEASTAWHTFNDIS